MNEKNYGRFVTRCLHRFFGSSYYSARVFSWIIEKLLGVDKALNKIVEESKPDCVITFLSGSSYLELEATKIRRRLNVPVLGIQHGWDNISTRGLMPEVPDYIGVWGYQSRIFAEKFHQMAPERVFHIGAPFTDDFRSLLQKSENEIRTELGLSFECKVILFAGNIWGYNEVKTLKVLDRAISEGKLKDCCVLYRPHPFQHKTTGDLNFFEEHFDHVHMDPCMKEVYARSSKEDKPVGTRNDRTMIEYRHMREILAVTSVIVAPISTVMLQGAMLGIPSVGIAYTDDANQHFNKRMGFEENNILRSTPGIFICTNPNELIEDCCLAIQFQEDEQNKGLLKKMFLHAVHEDDYSYSERVKMAIGSILHKSSDPAYEFLQRPVAAE